MGTVGITRWPELSVFGLLSTIDLAALIVLVVFGTIVLATGRAVRVNVRDVKATVEAAEKRASEAAQLAEQNVSTLGKSNGSDVTTMLARVLSELSEMRAWMNERDERDTSQCSDLGEKLRVLDELLTTRTPIFAEIRAELDELTAYTHTRFHDVLRTLIASSERIDLMWRDFIARRDEEGDETT